MTEKANDTDRQASKALQPWQKPTAEVLPVSETAINVVAGTDGGASSIGS